MTPAPRPTTASPPLAPKSVREAEIVVVGGGPCGSLAAAMLHFRGVSVTLIEKQDDFATFDLTRAYTQMLFMRGRKLVECFPGLLEHVSKEAILLSTRDVTIVPPTGKLVHLRTNEKSRDGKPHLRFLRSGILTAMKTYLERCDRVSPMYGTLVKSFSIEDDGWMQLSLESNGREDAIRTRFVLACDGIDSIVVKELQRLESSELLGTGPKDNIALSCSKGFDCDSYISPATGLKRKTVILNRAYVEELAASNNRAQKENAIITSQLFTGQRKDRVRNRVFNIYTFPLLPKSVEAVGGVLGSIVLKPKHVIWTITDDEKMYELFEENFPQLKVREAISPEQMRQFVSAKPSSYPSVSRCRSLGAYIASSSASGVIVMGDAAHSFPPDLGAGITVAFEDVGVLAKVIDEARSDSNVADIIQSYEKARNADTSAVVHLARYGSPYQFQQSDTGYMMWRLNVSLRRKLAVAFPVYLHRSITDLLKEDLSYDEIRRRVDLTTSRIFTGLAFVAIIPTVGWLFSRYLWSTQ